MDLAQLREEITSHPILASDGNHSMRLLRVVENVRDHADQPPSESGVLHLMSRVGVFSRSLSQDLRSGHITVEEASTLLDQLADAGEISLEEWLAQGSTPSN